MTDVAFPRLAVVCGPCCGVLGSPGRTLIVPFDLFVCDDAVWIGAAD